MNIHLTSEQARIVNDELQSGHFRSAEEVIAQALVALREKEGLSVAGDSNGRHEGAVRQMLKFVEENRTPLQGVSVKQLIREGHRLWVIWCWTRRWRFSGSIRPNLSFKA